MEIKKNVSLAELTTFKIGGKARYFCAVQSVPDLKKAVSFAKDKKLDFLVLGGGSNVLMRDGVLEGVVVKMEIKGMEYTGAISQSLRKKENVASGGEKQSPELKKTQSVSETRVFVRVGAGEWWDGFARNVAKRGLWGVENLSGIPGTVGAAPIQNIGAYGQEVDDTVVSVETLNTETLEERRFSNKQCRFGYRDSFFKTKEGKKYIITAVTFALRKDGKPNVSYQDIKKKIEDLGITIQGLSPMKMRQMVVEIRKKKFPDLKKYGTAGSFFKNPVVSEKKYGQLKNKWPDMPGFRVEEGIRKKELGIKISLAWILDKILEVHKVESYKVRKVKGGVGCFENQPIVVVNYGNASAKEVLELSARISKEVKNKTGIEIEKEVRVVNTKGKSFT